VSASSTNELWALIVPGYAERYPEYSEFSPDAEYLRDVLETKYSFSGINFLNSPYKNDLRNAITTWLGSHSDEDDTILIFITSHGGGLDELHGGGVDLSGDELDGIDECIFLCRGPGYSIEQYWDDEVRDDLANLTYWRLIFFIDTCYSGGFIRDLSAPGRIIVTPCNETSKAYCYALEPYESGYQEGYFSRPFIEALDNSTEAFDVADSNDDKRTSILEAFEYAWNTDPAVEGFWDGGLWIEETPQIDDNADQIPYFFGATQEPGELDLAGETYLTSQWCINDLNNDGLVDIDDVMIVSCAFGAYPSHPTWTPLADLTKDSLVDIDDVMIVANDFGEYATEWPYWC